MVLYVTPIADNAETRKLLLVTIVILEISYLQVCLAGHVVSTFLGHSIDFHSMEKK